MHRDLKPSNWAFVIDGQAESETRSEVIEREAVEREVVEREVVEREVVEREVDREGNLEVMVNLEGKTVADGDAAGAHPHSQHEQQRPARAGVAVARAEVLVEGEAEAEAEAGLRAGAGVNGGTATGGPSGPNGGTDDDGDSGIGQVGLELRISITLFRYFQVSLSSIYIGLGPVCRMIG